MSKPANIREIVTAHLLAGGFDGLLSEDSDCCCDFSRLLECCEFDTGEWPHCRPGYKAACDCEEEHLYHIGVAGSASEVTER